MIEPHQTQLKPQHNFSQYFVKRNNDVRRSNQKHIIRPQNTAFNSLSFRGQRGYSNDIMNKVLKRSPTYGAILRINKDNAPLYALVQGRYTGKWSFPKGHANEGEQPMECTMREVSEETGIKELPHPTQFLNVGYGNYYLFDFSEEIPLIPSDTNEIMDTRWVTLDEMNFLDLNSDANYLKRTLPLQ